VKTNWRDILYIDLWSLLRGDRPPRSALPVWVRRRQVRPKRERLGPVYRRRTSWTGPRYFRRSKWYSDLVRVTNQLASIVHCNAPIIEGLESAALDAPSARLEDVFLALREDISLGGSIAEAMENRPRFFPRYYVDLVAAGEKTGNLHESFTKLTDHLVRGEPFRQAAAGGALYFSVVFAIQCTVVSFLMVKVIPTFVAILADFDIAPPRSTRALVRTTDWMAAKWWLVLVCAGAVLILWRLFLRLYRQRGLSNRAVGSLGMCSLVLRRIISKRNLGHIASVLDMLLTGGVPLDSALDDAASLDVNPLYASLMRRLTERVRRGETLHEAIGTERWLVPRSFRTLVSIGESSGLLPEAFKRIADLYRRDVLKMNRILGDTIGPIVVFVLGAITLFINGSVFAILVRMTESILDSM